MSGISLTSFSARPYTFYHKSVMDFYNFAYSFSYRLLGYIHLPGLSLRNSVQVPCPLGCTHTGTASLKGGAHFTTCKRLGQHLRAHDALEDVVLLAMQDAISHRAATNYSGAYLTDEKRSHVRHNLATTISITPIHGGTDKGCFGDLLLVMNSTLPASGDHLGRTIGDLTVLNAFDYLVMVILIPILIIGTAVLLCSKYYAFYDTNSSIKSFNSTPLGSKSVIPSQNFAILYL